MTIFFQKVSRKGCTYLALLLILPFLSWPGFVRAQKSSRVYFAPDSLTVSISNIAIDGEFSLRGLTADFPYPVLSTINIVDSLGNPVIGLADTSHWLSPADMAQIGLPISEIWQPVLERHLENPSIPADPNVFDQTPEPLFTEVRETTLLPTATMLVMDASSSMKEEIADARTGARLFVDQLRPVDQAGVIIFGTTIKNFQGLTSSKQTLVATINQARARGSTALYDAIMAAIQELKTVGGRRGVIVYTDGMDNSSVNNNPTTVIDSAKVYKIPVFTIALGNDTNESNLQRVAKSTGGLFFKVATAEEMIEIYRLLSQLIKNFYVMAHTSPDPVRNNTFRVLDVTVNTPAQHGRGVGQYFVAGPPPPIQADLAVDLISITDTSVVVNGDTVRAVQPGDAYSYQIKVQNLGPGRADTLKVFHFLPDSVELVSASVAPTFVDPDLLVWQFDGLEAGGEFDISVDVHLAADIPRNLTELSSAAHVNADNDTLLANNISTDTLRVLFPPIVPRFDLEISQSALTDTTIVLGADTVQAVREADTFGYTLRVRNLGPADADKFTIRDVVPDSILVSNFNIAPNSQSGDTLFWQFDGLTVNDSVVVTFDATVPQNLPFTPFPLSNLSQIIAKNDSLEENNSALTTIYAVQRPEVMPGPTDLDVRISSITDTTIIIGSDTMNAVLPGDRYQYAIEVGNLGANQAVNVLLRQSLPDSVQFLEASQTPSFVRNDSLIWQFSAVDPAEALSILVSVQLANQVPEQLQELIAEADITAGNDTLLSNNADRDTVRVLHPGPAVKEYDLVMSQVAVTDTFVVIAGDTAQAVKRGDTYPYQLRIANSGPFPAHSIMVWDAIPDSVTVSDFNFQPVTRILNTFFWEFDSLGVGDTLKITFNAKVADTFETLPFELLNASQVDAADDTNPDNNLARTRVYAVARPGDQMMGQSDLSVRQTALTDSFAVVGKDTLRFARAGEIYAYRVTLTNESEVPAENVLLTDILPDSVTAVDFELAPKFQTKDSLQWNLGALLGETSVTLKFDVQVSPIMPIGTNLLVNKVDVQATNEDPNRLTNNTSVDTVLNIVRPPAGLLPLIEATPEIVDVGDTVTVRVQTLIPIRSWDLWVKFANGQIDSSYADAFISATQLPPDQWVEVQPRFTNTKLVTEAEQENIIFELRTVDVFGDLRSASDSVTVRSTNALVLERNVFAASREDVLGIRFRLSSNRRARLDVFDVSGSHITQLADAPFDAGWNTFNWNGSTENGQKIGSGLYIITLRSGAFEAFRKVMVVR